MTKLLILTNYVYLQIYIFVVPVLYYWHTFKDFVNILNFILF